MNPSGFHEQSYLNCSTFGTDSWLKRCLHWGGPVHYVVLGNETLAFISPVFYIGPCSRREGIAYFVVGCFFVFIIP